MSTHDTSAHRRIASELRNEIHTGVLAPGDRLPTELELAAKYEVARNTVRLALADLTAEGLIYTTAERKDGTRVSPRPVPLLLSRYASSADPDRERSHLGPWETALADAGVDGHMEVLGVVREPADEAVAARLGILAGDFVIRRDRRMHAAGRVAGTQSAWIPAEIADGTPLAGAEKIVGGVYAELTRQGHALVSADETVTAGLAAPADREALGLPRSASVLEVWRTTRDEQGRALETVRILASAAAVSLTYEGLRL